MAGDEFKKIEWAHHAGIYEVNLRQYTAEGSFKAFAEHLPRLKDMGVEVLWFMPITPIAQKNKKGSLGSYYACSDLTSVNPEFGTLEDFKDLIKHAQGLGFKVILDWVANHTGWDHIWTKEHPDYYFHDPSTHDFKKAKGMDDIIELDHKNPALRNAMIDAMRFWIKECSIDGFRCDLAFWVELDFWKAARTELEKIKTLFWLGEFDPLDNPEYYEAFDAAYTWTWMHKTEEYCKGKNDIHLLKNVLQRYDEVAKNNEMPLWFTSNHDENSWNGTEYEKYGDMAKALAVFSFTWNGIPLVYSGQEIPNKKRLPFFDKDVIEWEGSIKLHDFYKTVSELRKRNPALRAGDPAVSTNFLTTPAADPVLAYLRKKEEHEVLVFLNCSNSAVDLKFTDQFPVGEFTELFSRMHTVFLGKTFITMKPWEFLVFEKNNVAI